MYSDKRNVLQLISLMKAHGIHRVVLSPGSRNAPIIHSLATDPSFTCYSVVDERSAGFFALGVIQATGKPVAVCCTSGTAALNVASAVAEAYYQQLPLLVITADRPQSWIGQMDGQTLPQQQIYQSFIRYSVQLPEIKTENDDWYANRMINEAILALDNRVKGPVHINIPLSEPLFNFTQEGLPDVRVIRRSESVSVISESNDYPSRFAYYPKRMIVVGQMPYSAGLRNSLIRLAKEFDCLILCEHTANLPDDDCLIKNFDAILYAMPEKEKDAYAPDIVITMGGHIISKRLKQYLRSAHSKEHWHLSPSGEVVDISQHVTEIITSTPEVFISYLVEKAKPVRKKDFSYSAQWKSRSAEIPEPQVDFSDMYAVGELARNLPSKAVLHLANSSSVRLAQLFNLNALMCCNRGMNGIDGSLSTAVGYAAATDVLTFLLIGDLSFFYDINGIWNRHIGKNIRVLLNNNGGGEIFSTIPGLKKSEALPDYITASHKTSAKAWAEQSGFLYCSAKDEKELTAALPAFVSEETKSPVILEVFTSMEVNTTVLSEYYRNLKNK